MDNITSIEQLRVKRVFQENMDSYYMDTEIEFDAPTLEAVTTEATEAQFVSAKAYNIVCSVVNKPNNIVKVDFDMLSTTRVLCDEGGWETASAVKHSSEYYQIEGAGEDSMTVEAEVYPQCECYISERDIIGNVTEVICILGIIVLIQVVAEVDLLVPSYGYPPPPPNCDVFLNNCPEKYTPDWPPYPNNS